VTDKLRRALQQCGMDPSHEWELVRHNRDQLALAVCFRGASPTTDEIAALRRVIPEYREKPAAEVVAAIRGIGQVDLGVRSGMEARRLMKNADLQGLKIVAKDASVTIWQPRDLTAQQALLLEDEEEAERIAAMLIEAGIRVVPVEED